MGLEKYFKGYRIQEGSADEIEKDDKNLDSPGWRTVASGDTAEEALKNLISAMNEEEVYTDNNFYRLVLPDDTVADL